MKITCQNNGFSLIEVLVGLLINGFILCAVLTAYIASNNIHRKIDLKNEMEMNGRIALNLISNDLRHAGFFASLTGMPLRESQNIQFKGDIHPPVDCLDERGERGGSLPGLGNIAALRPLLIRHVDKQHHMNAKISCLAPVSLQDLSDVISVKRLLPDNLMSRHSDIQPNRVYMAIQHDHALMMKFDEQEKNIKLTNYSSLHEYQHHVYYIQNKNGIPELRLAYLTSDMSLSHSLALVPGVEHIRLMIGVDDSFPSDSIAERYVPAEKITNSEWNQFNFTGARIYLLIRSLNKDLDNKNADGYQLGDIYIPPVNDHYQRKLFIEQVSFVIRNGK